MPQDCPSRTIDSPHEDSGALTSLTYQVIIPCIAKSKREPEYLTSGVPRGERPDILRETERTRDAQLQHWTGKRVLITGAGGFIGSHLTEEMVRQGATVSALVHYNGRNDWGNIEALPADVKASIEVLTSDIRDPFITDRVVRGKAVVFHLAALIAIPYSYTAPASYIDTNVVGTLNVLQAAINHGVERVVQTSTSETYGTAMYTPMDESHPLQAQSPYAASKIGADKLAESFHRSFDAPVAILRPFNTFGPRQSARAVIPTIVSQALFRDRIELGSLTPIRDLTYVSDTVNGFLRIATAPDVAGEVVNIGRGEGVTVGEMARRITALLGTDKPVVSVAERARPERSEVLELICNNTKARESMGWAPQVSLDQGLRHVIDWVQANEQRFKSDHYNV
jgi:NAD dependent epimerase/dehydratase